ncbi:MAG: hypothetical protein WBA74_17435, partial [Cyclobacteriaceae bacterium]
AYNNFDSPTNSINDINTVSKSDLNNYRLQNIIIDYPFDKDQRDFQAPTSASKQYFYSMFLVADRIDKLQELPMLSNLFPCSAREIYKSCFDVLQKFLKNHYSGKELNSVDLEVPFHPSMKNDLLKAIGSNLSDLANAHICYLHIEEKIDFSYLKQIIPVRKKEKQNTDPKKVWQQNILINLKSQNNDSLFRIIINLYLLSAQFYLRSADYYRFSLQYKNLLIILKRMLQAGDGNNFSKREALENFRIIRALSSEAYLIADRNSSHTRRQRLYEWESYFNSKQANYKGLISDNELTEKEALFIDSFLNTPETKEIFILVKEFELLFFPERAVDLLIRSRLCTPYTVVNNQYNRLSELSFRSHVNYQIFRDILSNLTSAKDLDIFSNNKSISHINILGDLREATKVNIYRYHSLKMKPDDLLIFILSDSVFVLSEILRIYGIFGTGYLCCFSWVAIAHQHLGKWCQYINAIKQQKYDYEETEKFVIKLDKTLEELIGNVEFRALDVGYHYSRAIENYYACLELHNGGDAYDHTIENMFYLDDDFDDNLIHFSAAIERYRINTGYVRKRIDELKQKLYFKNEIDLFTEDNLVLK